MFCRTDFRQVSFFPRAVKDWNALPKRQCMPLPSTPSLRGCQSSDSHNCYPPPPPGLHPTCAPTPPPPPPHAFFLLFFLRTSVMVSFPPPPFFLLRTSVMVSSPSPPPPLISFFPFFFERQYAPTHPSPPPPLTFQTKDSLRNEPYAGVCILTGNIFSRPTRPHTCYGCICQGTINHSINQSNGICMEQIHMFKASHIILLWY